MKILMPMKIVAFQGSPRSGGNTDLLLSAFVQGVEEAGGAVDRVDLYRLEFSPCLECGGCDETGECILEDDLRGIYPRIEEANLIVVASPIFFYNVTSRTQALVERAQALWVRKYVLGRRLEVRPRYGLFLSLGATKGRRLFEGVQRVMRYFFDALDADYLGGLFFRGVEGKGAIRDHPEALPRARELGRAVGQEEAPETWPLTRDPSP